jgi:sugar lactone lactonase YvrE
MAHGIDIVDPQRFSVGESPVWRAREAALYWVDIARHTIVRWAAGDPQLRTWSFAEPVACIAFAGAARVLAGMQSGLAMIDLHDDGRATVQPVAAIDHPMASMRCNDGRCDRAGRFWFGTMHEDMAAAHAVGALRSFAAGVLSAPVVDDLVVQNGLAFSPDGATMYLSDSHPSRRLVWAFDYDAARGVPSRRRVFADLNHHVGRPDGAAIDVDGGYWSCANDGAALLRFAPDGALDRRIDLPVVKPSMCAFGGARMDTLYVTSIRPANAAADALDGCVLALSAGVQGIEEPEYSGLPEAFTSTSEPRQRRTGPSSDFQ